MAGCGHGTSSQVLLAPRWRSGGSIDEGAVAVASKRLRHGVGGGGEDKVPTVAACALVASMMVVRLGQRVRERKIGK
jgi:hypothetical protein